MIYLDYASTTMLQKEIRDTYVHLLDTYYANSDSLHDLGVESKKIVEQSRKVIADTLHVLPNEIIFTSGASEANNFAIKGYALSHTHIGKHLITSCVEHSSVFNTMKFLESEMGFEVTYLPVNEKGQVTLSSLKEALRKDTILVSVMGVNNEVGSINEINKMADLIHETRAVFHVDGVQQLGKLPVDLKNIDMATFSAHKIYGLKGSGILVKKTNISLHPLIHGGQQEMGLRGGTTNVAADVVLAKTIRLSVEAVNKRYDYVQKINEYTRNKLSEIEEISINSDIHGSPYILNISCSCITSEVMLNAMNMKGIAISAQSTCSSRTHSPSKVLTAMGFDEERVKRSVRLSFSHLTTLAEIDTFIQSLKEVIHVYRTK